MAFKWAQDDPRFQRTLQKLRAMTPESKAIFDAGSAEAAWAKTNAAKRLRLMQIGNELRNRERRFNITMDYQRGLAQQRKKAFRGRKRQERFANILGAAGVGISGLLSHKRNILNLRQARRTQQLLERISK